jgi:CheY-like chemotaxis protein
MGGSLAVVSRPGGGRPVKLVAVVRTAAPELRRRAKAVAAAPRLRVLCVEDNPYGRLVLGTMLRELGHRVAFVGSGEAAVEAVSRRRHDVVLMDVALAGIDGLEAARRIRALPHPVGAVPIIGVSGRTEPRDAEAAKAAGMNAYLRKPATPAELSEVLQAIAGKE